MSPGQQNGGLPTVAVSRAMLATARGRRKLDVILDAPDPRAFVRQLPAEDLYFAIREIGLEDSAAIVALASPNQFRAFVDLDVWHQSLPDPQRILGWLQLAADGERETKGYRSKRAALDAELVLVVLQRYAKIHALEENEDPEYESSNIVRTAEGKYTVEITDEGPEGMAARRLVEDFIDEKPFEATRLFEAVRWESLAELEETALRWRTGRLRDMGFPELEEAIRIWAPLPTGWKPSSSGVEPGPVAGVPALLLVSSRAPLFLDRVVERLPDASRPFFNEGLIYLLNCAIVADGIEPRDLELARETLAATRDMLSLGLELASGGAEDAALAILGSTAPVELFRSAVGRISALARAATTAARPLSSAAGAAPLDSPDSELISGLRRKRPRFYDPAGPGEQRKRGDDWRAFRTPADLQIAEAAIRRVQATVEGLKALAIDAAALASLAEASGRALTAVTAGQVLLTAAIRGTPPVAPIPAGEVSRLCELFADGRLQDGRIQAWFATLRGRVSAEFTGAFDEVVARLLRRFEDEVGPPCAAGGIEAAYVETLLIAGATAPAEVTAES